MGWDVVQIGLRHNLPIDDPFATAREIAKRMNRNIVLVYRNMYEYDIANNIVYDIDDEPYSIELGKIEVDSSTDYLTMEVNNYQANKILEIAGIENLRVASCKNEPGKYLLDDIENSYYLYEINSRDILITIYKENIEFGACVYENWPYFEGAFHLLSPDDIEWLKNYRMQIYNCAKMFGCDEVIICCNHGPGEFIYTKMDLSADELKEYARSFQYIEDYGKCDGRFDVNEWKKSAKHIFFPSFFNNQVILSDDDSVDVIYDDFSDLR